MRIELKDTPTHQISALSECGSVRPIFVFWSLNKIGSLASESINYEAKTIINFKNKSTHQISALYRSVGAAMTHSQVMD